MKFLDTETTGLSLKMDTKLLRQPVQKLEICTYGKVFHKLINPKRNVPNEAFKIHGFSEEFLKDKFTFDLIADEFLKFIKDKKNYHT